MGHALSLLKAITKAKKKPFVNEQSKLPKLTNPVVRVEEYGEKLTITGV